jgi:nucleoid-associated protein YgaU
MQLHALTVRGIPAPLLRVLKAAAKRNRRSLNAEVLVRLEAAAADAEPRRSAPPSAAAREPEVPPYAVRKAFEEADLARLRSDLALTPEQRVLLADQMLDDALATRPRPTVHTIRAFDTWEDYLAWKRTDHLR